MKKLFHLLPLFAALIFLASCNEKNEADEYENWQARNQHYVDSIAVLAANGTDGWTRILSYKLVEKEGESLTNNCYIYVQKLENGDGERKPEFNDSVRAHYLGRLIPSASHAQGTVFGRSYKTYALNEETDVPALLPAAGNNVVGMATAFMHMVEGDRWKVVIPYDLGYGESTYSTAGIPGYSTLIFDVKLARIYRYQIDTDTTWH